MRALIGAVIANRATFKRARLEQKPNNKRTTGGGPKVKKDCTTCPTVVAADLTAATPADRRQIIADWRKPKLGRLWKSSLATHAQLAANAVDMLESVNVTVASRKSERSTY